VVVMNAIRLVRPKPCDHGDGDGGSDDIHCCEDSGGHDAIMTVYKVPEGLGCKVCSNKGLNHV
jgi:hypothetical protein